MEFVEKKPGEKLMTKTIDGRDGAGAVEEMETESTDILILISNNNKFLKNYSSVTTLIVSNSST